MPKKKYAPQSAEWIKGSRKGYNAVEQLGWTDDGFDEGGRSYLYHRKRGKVCHNLPKTTLKLIRALKDERATHRTKFRKQWYGAYKKKGSRRGKGGGPWSTPKGVIAKAKYNELKAGHGKANFAQHKRWQQEAWAYAADQLG